MKWEITYMLKGPLGNIVKDVPNKPPLIDADSLHDVLRHLSEYIPKTPNGLGIEFIGVTVKPAEKQS